MKAGLAVGVANSVFWLMARPAPPLEAAGHATGIIAGCTRIEVERK
jgi:xanthosine utilization system XapX-like protein